jgi:RNA polymerase sigma-70 factor (ECF subfamily)
MTPVENPSRGLDRFRTYLRRLGRFRLHGTPDHHVDLSGVIQLTLLEAHRAGERFPRKAEAEQTAWLRTAFDHNLADALRRARARVRDVSRERSLEEFLGETSTPAAGWLAADQSSPSQRVTRTEDLVRLAAALEALPEDQRRAVELHHLQGLTVAEVAGRMGRTKESVAGLLFRGLKWLRESLGE